VNSKLKGISNELQTSEERNKTASVAPPSVYDQIGPADPVSNIRPIRYFVPENESRLHKKYRLFRQETHNFSHQFWENHNVQFAEVQKHANIISEFYFKKNPTIHLSEGAKQNYVLKAIKFSF
jgi:hypothetical protein